MILVLSFYLRVDCAYIYFALFWQANLVFALQASQTCQTNTMGAKQKIEF
ncbi:hypothetical protein CLV81_0869 [Flagellimonas meridianipacifica]|uniref:Uncharacterized protein n=1 Tax=Flagellimonas meridianipacifica TaxID=1080225 RepID=A0A2T0MH18_9FLAO|nr:hypothetical protein CLV81_0869 [Allomuricauda pacifica]